LARNQDLIEFEEESEGPRISLGGVAGALVGALLGYKLATQVGVSGTPVPLPSKVQIAGEDVQVDLIDVSLKMGILAAIGYGIGAFVTKARHPRRFRLLHKD
jgi:uncharacterized membrane protein YfcA